MESSDNIKEYDEDEAIKYILTNLPQEISEKYTDDDILLIIDSIFDFYEDKGFFSMDNLDGEDDFEEGELIEYVKKSVKKDPNQSIKMDDVANIVHLELEYEDSINEL